MTVIWKEDLRFVSPSFLPESIQPVLSPFKVILLKNSLLLLCWTEMCVSLRSRSFSTMLKAAYFFFCEGMGVTALGYNEIQLTAINLSMVMKFVPLLSFATYLLTRFHFLYISTTFLKNNFGFFCFQSFHAELHQYKYHIELFNSLTQRLIAVYQQDDTTHVKKITEAVNMRYNNLNTK